MSRFGVMKHLRVLHEAGLIRVENRGRERWNHLNPAPIQKLYRHWIRDFEEPLRENEMTQAQDTDLQAVHILVELRIEASRPRVFECFVDETAAWWREDFFTRPGLGAFRIERKLGGMMYEDWGNGEGQIWAQVSGLKAPEYIQLAGDTDRAWGGPSRGIMTVTFEEEAGGTRLRFEHSNFGHVSEATRESLEAGWKELLGDGLKPYAESR